MKRPQPLHICPIILSLQINVSLLFSTCYPSTQLAPSPLLHLIPTTQHIHVPPPINTCPPLKHFPLFPLFFVLSLTLSAFTSQPHSTPTLRRSTFPLQPLFSSYPHDSVEIFPCQFFLYALPLHIHSHYHRSKSSHYNYPYDSAN